MRRTRQRVRISLSRPRWPTYSGTTSAGRRRSITPPVSAARFGAQDLSQTRGSGPYRRAQDQQRAGPGPAGARGWASGGSSPRPARGSTALPRRRSAPCSAWNASSTWARRTCERQALNVFRMRLLGAEVRPVAAGSRTLKDAINEAMRDWVTNVADTYYLIGSVVGPHPYPTMVRDFQSRDRPRGAGADPRRMGGCPMRSSPASAAAATRSASFTRSSAMRTCG